MGFYGRHVFPRLVDWVMSSGAFSQARAEALAPAQGRVLEVGFGTGLNLPHYPAGVTSLTTVDPNPGMNARARERVAAAPFEVTQCVLSGESLPLPDAGFDTVVSTWTLCSIPDVAAALAEMRRVLRPGGRLCFVEHGLAPEPGLQRWQRRLTPVQKLIGDGCHLDRDIRALVVDAGFRLERLSNFWMRGLPRIGAWMYLGTACRAE